jgi:protein TonB
LPPRPQRKPRAPAAPTPSPDTAPATPQATQEPGPQPRQAAPPPASDAPQEAPPSAAGDKAAAAAPAAAGIGTGPAGPGGVGQGSEGQGHGIAGNGPQDGPGDDYLDRLRRWLARYKKYPEEALKRKVEGEVVVAFTLARDGTVLSAPVEKSSGNPLLDQAAVQMLHDASPVPPVPERYKGRELRLTIPVDYSIGLFERLFR